MHGVGKRAQVGQEHVDDIAQVAQGVRSGPDTRARRCVADRGRRARSRSRCGTAVNSRNAAMNRCPQRERQARGRSPPRSPLPAVPAVARRRRHLRRALRVLGRGHRDRLGGGGSRPAAPTSGPPGASPPCTRWSPACGAVPSSAAARSISSGTRASPHQAAHFAGRRGGWLHPGRARIPDEGTGPRCVRPARRRAGGGPHRRTSTRASSISTRRGGSRENFRQVEAGHPHAEQARPVVLGGRAARACPPRPACG